MDLDAAELDFSNYYNSVIDMPADKTLILTIYASNPGLAGTHTAYVHIVAGNLTNVVTVKKEGRINV
ncbi:MAG: hypothetical protein LUE93_00795 [Bacteroides sp.]|nr:hypothetical protein [Bacteroides sp.]